MSTVTYYLNNYDNDIAWNWQPANMVDGTDWYYAETSIDAIQLCNSNTCVGIDLGTITKVEMRVRHRDEDAANILYIQPIFSGGNGDVHTIPNVINVAWSDWFDITTDTNTPSNWTWTNIANIDCNVESDINSVNDIRVYKIEIRVTYNNYPGECGNCNNFVIIGDTYTVNLKMPHHNGENNSIKKNTNRFNFWSDNYGVHDDGINSQPLVLNGVESASCDEQYVGLQLGECAQFNLYFNMKFTNKFRFLMEMSNNNEEVTISGLGDCMDAVYIIKHFSYKTLTPHSRSWTMTLEKVR